MVISGVTVLGICFILGMIIGEILGTILHIDANIGGVGFAILLFVFLVDYLQKNNRFKASTQHGISFWSAMFIPIIVAMAAKQDVYSAIKGGPMAILAGLTATLICFLLIRFLDNAGKNHSNLNTSNDEQVNRTAD